MRYRELRIAVIIVTLIVAQLVAFLAILLIRDYSGSHPLSLVALAEIGLVTFILIVPGVIGLFLSAVLLARADGAKTLSSIGITVNTFAIVFCLIVLYILRPWDPKAERFDMIEHGRYEIRGDPGALDSFVNTSTTDTIPAILGGKFGFKYIVYGRPKGISLPLKKVTSFPSPGLWDSTLKSYRKELITALPSVVLDTNYSGYSFDDSTELLQGQWTMQVWFEERLLAQRTFQIFVPIDSSAMH